MHHTTHLTSIELIALILAALVFVLVIRALRGLAKLIAKDIILALVWRHFSGAHYHGKRRTDATWLRHGTTSDRKYDHDGFMSRWEHKPRAHRALWRWGCTLAVFGLGYGLLADRAVTLNAIKAFGVYLVVAGGFLIESKYRLRLHNRHVLNPIAKSLAVQLRLSPHAVRRLLHIDPENITDEGEVGYLELPPEITPGDDQKSSVERIIDAHLPVDIEMDWKMQQAPKLGVIRAGLRPPAEVPWDETVTAMRNAAYGDIIIGKDRYKQAYAANFIHLDDPHWAFSVNTKRGKSNFLGLVCVQVLHQDPMAQVICIDPKRSSLIDFLGSPVPGPGLKPLLPGVTMANDPTRVEDMWNAVSSMRKLLEDRSRQAERDRSKKFPVALLVIDELNMFQEITDDAWAAYRAENYRRPKEDQEDLPKECPVWADIRAILRTGRFVACHEIALAQDFRDAAIGGKGARNYFGLRGMGGYHPNQWKYFVGTTPVPVQQRGMGRWIFTQGEDQAWVQITKCDPDKAYAWAAHGRELFVPEQYVHDADALSSQPLSLAQQTDGHPAQEMLEPPRSQITGLEAASRYLGMKQVTFEKARQRMPGKVIPGEFRTGRQPSWYADDLDAWKRNRPGNKEEQHAEEG